MGRATEIVERVLELGHTRLAEAVELLHPDVVWEPGPDQPPLRGHEAIRGYVERELERLGSSVPETSPISLVEHGDHVVVLARMRMPRGIGAHSFVEVTSIASVYDVEGDRIVRIRAYREWNDACAAAGIDPGTPATRRFQTGWRLVVTRRTRTIMQWRPQPREAQSGRTRARSTAG
jgi:ketosteroid isomerase-like protein